MATPQPVSSPLPRRANHDTKPPARTQEAPSANSKSLPPRLRVSASNPPADSKRTPPSSPLPRRANHDTILPSRTQEAHSANSKSLPPRLRVSASNSPAANPKPPHANEPPHPPSSPLPRRANHDMAPQFRTQEAPSLNSASRRLGGEILAPSTPPCDPR